MRVLRAGASAVKILTGMGAKSGRKRGEGGGAKKKDTGVSRGMLPKLPDTEDHLVTRTKRGPHMSDNMPSKAFGGAPSGWQHPPVAASEMMTCT